MKGGLQIKHLTRTEVDVKAWNACITTAANGLIYGYSFYLDALADDWDALVLNHYEAVMPLPWRKKWGISYLYQPALTAQLGVFGHAVTDEMLTGFLQAIPKKFRLWELSLNHQNLFFHVLFPIYKRTNFILPLNQPYEQLYKAYRENIRRNCKKAKGYGCVVSTTITSNDVIRLAKLQPAAPSANDFQKFENLYTILKQKGMAEIYGILSKNGEVLASAVFLFSHNRAYYILVGNHPNGRTLGASHALIDAFIHDHAAQDLLLDFEGSDIRNLAFFYSSFGATEEAYAAIAWNRLPWWARWLKGKHR